jgi:hypothetical protein
MYSYFRYDTSAAKKLAFALFYVALLKDLLVLTGEYFFTGTYSTVCVFIRA